MQEIAAVRQRSRLSAHRAAAGAQGHADEPEEAVSALPRRRAVGPAQAGPQARPWHAHTDAPGPHAQPALVVGPSPWSLGPSPIGLEPMAPRWATVPMARWRTGSGRRASSLAMVLEPMAHQARPGGDRRLLPREPVPGRRHQHLGREGGPRLDALVRIYGKPACIVSDNGTEFTSRAILKWADQNGVAWHCIDPGKPQRDTPSSKASTAACATSC